jgi:hypothetical protein
MMSTVTARHVRRHSPTAALPGHKRGEKRDKGTWRTKKWTKIRRIDALIDFAIEIDRRRAK